MEMGVEMVAARAVEKAVEVEVAKGGGEEGGGEGGGWRRCTRRQKRWRRSKWHSLERCGGTLASCVANAQERESARRGRGDCGSIIVLAACAGCTPPATAYKTYSPPPAYCNWIVSPAVYVPPSDFPVTVKALPALGVAPMMFAQVAVVQAGLHLTDSEAHGPAPAARSQGARAPRASSAPS